MRSPTPEVYRKGKHLSAQFQVAKSWLTLDTSAKHILDVFVFLLGMILSLLVLWM